MVRTKQTYLAYQHKHTEQGVTNIVYELFCRNVKLP